MSIASAMSGMSEGKVPQERERGPEDGGDTEDSDIQAHLKAMHEKDGGAHMHIRSDGMSHTSHHVTEGGEMKGPHEHHDTEALKEHVGKFADGNEDGQDEHSDDSIFSE